MAKTEKRAKLAPSDWYQAGLEALAERGPDALKAARVARALGVTTGSFYWHFSGIEEFRTGLLRYWKDQIIVGLMRAAKASSDEPAEVLADLRQRILASGAHRFDTALRSWARSDAIARETVERADEIRVGFLIEMLCKTGMSESKARDRAHLIGAAWRGTGGEDAGYRMKLAGLAAGLEAD